MSDIEFTLELGDPQDLIRSEVFDDWMERQAEAVAAVARQEAPRGESGDLADNIEVDHGDGPGEWVVRANTSYAIYVHEGTKPHEIRPVRAKALRWVDGRKVRFARRVWHPGTKGNPFLIRALRKVFG